MFVCGVVNGAPFHFGVEYQMILDEHNEGTFDLTEWKACLLGDFMEWLTAIVGENRVNTLFAKL